jgi:hypothetical protein
MHARNANEHTPYLGGGPQVGMVAKRLGLWPAMPGPAALG